MRYMITEVVWDYSRARKTVTMRSNIRLINRLFTKMSVTIKKGWMAQNEVLV